MRICRSLLLLACLLPLALSAQNARVVTRVTKDPAPAWKTWKSDGLAMNYPAQWILEEPAQGDTLVIIRKEVAEETDAATAPKLIVQAMPEGGHMATGRTERHAEHDGLALKTMVEIVNEGSRTFRLTYTAPEAKYEEFLYMAEAMMNSFATGD